MVQHDAGKMSKWLTLCYLYERADIVGAHRCKPLVVGMDVGQFYGLDLIQGRLQRCRCVLDERQPDIAIVTLFSFCG